MVGINITTSIIVPSYQSKAQREAMQELLEWMRKHSRGKK